MTTERTLARERFEKWAKSSLADRPLDYTECPNHCAGLGFHYENQWTAWAFSAWQAGASDAIEEEARILEQANLLRKWAGSDVPKDVRDAYIFSAQRIERLIGSMRTRHGLAEK